MTEQGEVKQDVQIRRDGDQIVIPNNMSYTEAQNWLRRQMEKEEEIVAVHREWEAFPLDGAVALIRAMKNIYGFTDLEADHHPFFGDRPPMIVEVPTGPNGETESVPWGKIKVPGVQGTLRPGVSGCWFMIHGEVRQGDMPKVERVLAEVNRLLRAKSIYKGRAIEVAFNYLDADGDLNDDFHPVQHAPKFLDVTDAEPSSLIFAAELHDRIRASIFTPITRRQECGKWGIPAKRGVLLGGPYGVGKTLTARVTANLCEHNDTTFMLVRDAKDLTHALRVAERYAPAVVFCEDADRVTDGDRSASMDSLLNTLDGVGSKSSQVLTVLTSNHIENIHPAMLRPGRIDDVIVLGPPDSEAALRLVHQYGHGRLGRGDYGPVGESLAGKIPAVIREVVERAKLVALSRDDDRQEIMPDDLTLASHGMDEHLELLNKEAKPKRHLLERFGDAMGKRLIDGMNETILRSYLRGEKPGDLLDDMGKSTDN